MLQRTALIISTALTVLTVLVGLGLALRVASSSAPIEDAADGSRSSEQNDPAARYSEQNAEQDAVYREAFERLSAANTALATSYQRIDALREEMRQLQEQNATLRQREATYQERLAQANSRLERLNAGAVPVPAVAAPAVVANSVPDESPATPAAASEPVVAVPALAAAQAPPSIPAGLSLLVPGRTIPLEPVAPAATRPDSSASAAPAPAATPTQAARPASRLVAGLQSIDSRAASALTSAISQATPPKRKERDDDDREKRSERQERSSSRERR